VVGRKKSEFVFVVQPKARVRVRFFIQSVSHSKTGAKLDLI
jgi:hypothetical protein